VTLASSRLVAAFSWDPQVKGALYVAIAVVILCGSCYMLLATNMGARLGLLLAMAGIFGWLSTLGTIWWVYGKGPVGLDPTWKQVALVTGNPSSANVNALNGFPSGWKKLGPTDKEVADAAPAADAALIATPGGPPAPFKSSSDFVVTGAFQKGGKKHGVLGLNFRPFNLWHTPHYLVVEAQKAVTPPAVEGQPPPKPVADASAQPISVVLLRNLGDRRLHPAVFTISASIIFGLVIYQLHTRDKEAAARRQAEAEVGSGSGRLQPVAR
jgi:hypothetical protein